jgi:protein SCO1
MTTRSLSSLLRVATALAALALATGARAAECTPEHRAQAAAAKAEVAAAGAGAQIDVPDLVLVDQDGVAKRFRSEVIGDRVVVVDFVFTTCTTICPVLTAIMLRLQRQLGDRLGKDVALVTVTVDPARDTPQRLRLQAGKVGARPGWTWITGRKDDVDLVNKALGSYTASFADHPPMMLVADGRSGAWYRFNGFPQTSRLLAKIDELVAARPGPATASAGGEVSP